MNPGDLSYHILVCVHTSMLGKALQHCLCKHLTMSRMSCNIIGVVAFRSDPVSDSVHAN